jgi:hypothetical protein
VTKISEYARKRLEAALADDASDSNPFVREGGTTFARHDQMVLREIGPGLFEIEFRWRGQGVYSMRTQCNFAAGEVFTLSGIDGRMAVQLHTN